MAKSKDKSKNARAAEDAAYREKIALFNAAFLKRKAEEGAEASKANRKKSWGKIKKSVPRLISLLPTRSHSELLAIYKNCRNKMLGRSTAEISSAVLELHSALQDEWQRRTTSLTAGDGYFEWPTTDAPQGDGTLSGGTWWSVGMLSELGYHVGATKGLPDIERRFLLDQMFEIHLPPLNDYAYMLKWDCPKSAARLKQLAETIAALVRDGKRRKSQDMRAACDDWQSDLDYLYEKYYVHHFRFSWPAT